jgi:hypothetical protein
MAMEKVPYRAKFGKLLYLSTATRPDICHVVSMVSRFNQNPGRQHWEAVKRIVKYLIGTPNMVGIVLGGHLENPFLLS